MEEIITKKKSLIIYGIAFVIIPMVLGAILYYVFCPDVWFVKVIDGWFGKANRPAINLMEHNLLRLLRNYAFDFIWAFALTNALYIIFNNNAKPYMICLAVPVMLGIAMEILQLLGIAQGTFDLWDVLVEWGGTVLGAFIIIFFRRLLNEEK